MSVILPPPPVKPFAAVFAGDSRYIAAGISGLSAILDDEPDLVSPEFSLTETTYYEKEMGPGLVKVYVSWPRLLSPESLAGVKLSALEWESRHTRDGRRLANLDPGYVFTGGLVLSTGKFREHRLPLGQGVWGELTLSYRQGRFEALSWTYPDYRRPEIQAWLMAMRQAFISALKQGAGQAPGRCL